MKLGDAKRKALILMREYTNDGRPIQDRDNSDYLLSMDDLADQAQKLIAKRQKIHATFILDPKAGAPYGHLSVYDMPSDFASVDRVEYVEADKPANIHPASLFRWLTPVTLGVVKGLAGLFYIYYFKHPTTITPNPQNEKVNNEYEFEVDEEAQELIPFFMAAQLLMDEDASRGVLKLNEFHAKLDELETREYASPTKRILNTMGW